MNEKEGYQIRNQDGLYFLTFTTINWIDVFTRREYRDIIIKNLRYSRDNKDLNIHAFVIMSNHMHVILSSHSGKLSDTIRDFKSFSSKEIAKAILEIPESRRNWLLNQMQYIASQTKRNETYQLWTHDNLPEELFSPAFIKQKADYIHNNPVRAGWVDSPEEYLYSSAKNYIGKEGLMEVDLLW